MAMPDSHTHSESMDPIVFDQILSDVRDTMSTLEPRFERSMLQSHRIHTHSDAEFLCHARERRSIAEGIPRFVLDFFECVRGSGGSGSPHVVADGQCHGQLHCTSATRTSRHQRAFEMDSPACGRDRPFTSSTASHTSV